MMKISVLAFGIAKDIFKSNALEVELTDDSTIQKLKELLSSKYPELNKLRSLSFAVNEEYQDDSYKLSDQDEVVIIPPVSGG